MIHFLLLSLLSFQDLEPPPPIEEDQIKVDFTETVVRVNLPLKVQRLGFPYSDLKREQIELLENGIPVAIDRLKTIETNLTVHYLFDLSTSHSKHILTIKKGMKAFLKKMQPGDRAKISFFSTHYQSLTDYTNNAKLLRRMVSRLAPIGSTALYDGMAEALKELSRQRGARVLILFTDGHDLISRTGEKELRTMSKNFGIPMILVAFGSWDNEKPLLAAQTRFMRELVHDSGGKIFKSDSAFTRRMLKFLTMQRPRYVITYTPNNLDQLDQWRTVSIRLSKCDDCHLEFRRAYKLR